MKITKEIRIALVAIVGILVMYFGINFLKGINLFSSNNYYYMTFDDIQGLGASTPIYADGYKVGTVDAVDFDYSKTGPIKVKADIDQNLRIPQGSQAEIVKDLMGNLQVNLLLANNPRERIEPGGIIPGAVNMVPWAKFLPWYLSSRRCCLSWIPSLPASMPCWLTLPWQLRFTMCRPSPATSRFLHES